VADAVREPEENKMSFPYLKAACDSVAVPTAFLAWLQPIDIPKAAALLAGIYTALRILELLYGWFVVLHRKWRRS
jgi:hypothetical protein